MRALRYRAPIIMVPWEIEQSYWLADLGFYRQAVAGLRTALELAALAFHLARRETALSVFQGWLMGNDDPIMFKRQVLKPLLASPRVRRFDQAGAMRVDIENCYRELCAFSHSRGVPHSAMGLAPKTIHDIPRHALSASALKQYSSFLRDVTRCSVTMAFLRYPIALQDLPLYEKFPVEHFPKGLLTADERQAACKVLAPRTVKALKALSDSDHGVQWMVKQVRDLPDLNTPKGEEEWDLDAHYDRFALWFAEYERRSSEQG